MGNDANQDDHDSLLSTHCDPELYWNLHAGSPRVFRTLRSATVARLVVSSSQSRAKSASLHGRPMLDEANKSPWAGHVFSMQRARAFHVLPSAGAHGRRKLDGRRKLVDTKDSRAVSSSSSRELYVAREEQVESRKPNSARCFTAARVRPVPMTYKVQMSRLITTTRLKNVDDPVKETRFAADGEAQLCNLNPQIVADVTDKKRSRRLLQNHSIETITSKIRLICDMENRLGLA